MGSLAFLIFFIPSVAQKQSTRPISEGLWSVTTLKDQPSLSELRLGESAITVRKDP